MELERFDLPHASHRNAIHNLLCAICRRVSINPHQCLCPNRHLFCLQCIDDHLKQSSTCPIDSSFALFPHSISPSPMHAHFVNILNVRCINYISPTNTPTCKKEALDNTNGKETGNEKKIQNQNQNQNSNDLASSNNRPPGKDSDKSPSLSSRETTNVGAETKVPLLRLRKRKRMALRQSCDWKGTVNDLHSHEKICLFRRKQCSRCSEYVLESEIDVSHPLVCPKQLQACDFCQELVPRVQLDHHLNHECKSVTMPCPHGCNTFVKRSELEEHSAQCSSRKVECSFARVGCTARLDARQMKQHVEDYSVEHMAMMCKAFADLQQSHADLIQAHAVVIQCLQDANLAVPHQSLPVSVVDQLRKQACRPLLHAKPHSAPDHPERPASKVFTLDDEDTTADIERRRQRQEEPPHHVAEQRSENADPRRQSLTRNVAMALDRNQEFLIDLSNDDDDDVLGDKDYCGS